MSRTKDIYRVGVGMLSEGMRIPGWWRTRRYEQMREQWSHRILLESLREDIAEGEQPPPDVLNHFPELR